MLNNRFSDELNIGNQLNRKGKLRSELLSSSFGDRMKERVPIARFTAARVGGLVDFLIVVYSAEELAEAAKLLWKNEEKFILIGGGSNVLVSDLGVRGVVIINQARAMQFDEGNDSPSVWAESGANFGAMARRAALRGLTGLEWAAGIPGSVGGAVYGNAGAHDCDIAGCLIMADILHRNGNQEQWSVERLQYSYRSSLLKMHPGEAVILAASFRLENSSPENVQEKMEAYSSYRHSKQPPGASMGSMFKNPPGDFAGRLIDAAGLKGTKIGGAEISTVHANFFINHGEATSSDIYHLIRLAQLKVAEEFDVQLELEIEFVGEWDNSQEVSYPIIE